MNTPKYSLKNFFSQSNDKKTQNEPKMSLLYFSGNLCVTFLKKYFHQASRLGRKKTALRMVIACLI